MSILKTVVAAVPAAQATRLPLQRRRSSTNHSHGSSYPSRRKISKRRCRCCARATFHFSTLGKSAVTSCAFARTTKLSTGRLSIFTTIGGTPFVARSKAIRWPSAFQVCEARSKRHLRGSDSRKLRSLFGSSSFRAIRNGHGRAFKGRATQERSGVGLRNRHSHALATRQPRPSGATCRHRSQPRDACICAEEIQRK